jgi:hypothetical protein
MLENLDYNRILAMLPVGLIGFMLQKKLEEGFYADPPKNKLGRRHAIRKQSITTGILCILAKMMTA